MTKSHKDFAEGTAEKLADVLAHALARSAAALNDGAPLEIQIRRALENIGLAVGAARVTLCEDASTRDFVPAFGSCTWLSPHVQDAPQPCSPRELMERVLARDPDAMSWKSPLRRGEIITGTTDTVCSRIKDIFKLTNLTSLTVLPVSVDSAYWGSIDVEDSDVMRRWSAAEIDMLKIFAGLVGGAIDRARYAEKIAAAHASGREDAETKLATVRSVLTTALETSPDGMVVTDADGRVVLFNRQFTDLFGFPPDMAAANDDELLLALKSKVKDEKSFLAQMRALAEQPEKKLNDELELKDGRFVDCNTATLYDPQRNYNGRIWYFRDITERKRAERKSARLVRTDPLTALPNRGVFVDRLNAAFAAAKRGGDSFAVLYLDVDRFKDVNDTLGHLAGDALLRAVGRRILETVREADFVARIGGDEFAVLQADLGDPAHAGTLAAKMRDALGEPYAVEESGVHVTISIGISFYTPETTGPGEMLAQADKALRRAKQGGRNQHRFHSSELDKLVRERVSAGEELRLGPRAQRSTTRPKSPSDAA